MKSPHSSQPHAHPVHLRLAAAVCSLCSTLWSLPPGSDSHQTPAATGTTELVAPLVSVEGQSFRLAQSYGTPEIETHEYTLEGEGLKDWSQLVTVQRLTTAGSGRPEDFVAYARERLGRDGNATVLTQPAGRRSGLFTVHFLKTEDQEEQIAVCLVISSPTESKRLQILQYAAKPGRLSPPQLEMQLRAWRGRFQAQARQLEGERPENAH